MPLINVSTLLADEVLQERTFCHREQSAPTSGTFLILGPTRKSPAPEIDRQRRKNGKALRPPGLEGQRDLWWPVLKTWHAGLVKA